MIGLRTLVLALAGLLQALGGLPAFAQAPAAFDGTWQLQGARSADPFCSQLFWHPLTLRQGVFSGTIGHTRGTFNVTGQVAADGKATFFGDGPYGHLGRGFGQFTANGASGTIRFTGPDIYCETGWTATRKG